MDLFSDRVDDEVLVLDFDFDFARAADLGGGGK